MSFKITKKELKLRIGYLLAGATGSLAMLDLYDRLAENTLVPVWFIGIVGFFITLYFFDF